MLIRFRVENFRSFREEQELSLVAANGVSELQENVIDAQLPGLKGVKLLRGAAIYGANASGKSNVIAALLFLVNLVRGSATDLKPGQPIPVTPFKLDPDSAKAPTSFEIVFVAEGVRYEYFVKLNRERILEEQLAAFPKGRAQLWFSRRFDEGVNRDTWEGGSVGGADDEALQGRTRPNALFLSVAAQFNHERLGPLHWWFLRQVRLLEADLPGADTMWTHLDEIAVTSQSTLRWLEQSDWAKSFFLEMLTGADFGIADISINPADELDEGERKGVLSRQVLGVPGPAKGRRLEPEPILHHRGTMGAVVPLDFQSEESAGTRRFLALLGPWLEAIEQGCLLVIDELEASLHPLLVRELAGLLLQLGSRDCSPQLIFTTHNPFLLDRNLLRRDQVWFTEKDGEGASHLYPLTDYKPRKGEALSRGYLAGRYGGIPFIPEGLLKP